MKQQNVFGKFRNATFRASIFVLMIGTAISACKKKQDQNVPDPVIPVEKGEVIGTPTQKTIGANGGSITTPDANVKLVIPAGALKSNVNISVQEVTSTFGPLAVGKTYRLLPEDVQFEKEVELTFKYDSEGLNGTRRELLYLAYQNAKGEWYTASKTQFDPYNNIVSVKTKHFSDWVPYAHAKIVATGKDDLLAKESVKLSVIYVSAPQDLSIDALLGPADPTDLVKNWSPISDPEYWGKLESNKDNAVFTAPNLITSGRLSQITANINLSKFKVGAGRSQPSGTYALTHGVILLPDEYVRRLDIDFFPNIEKSFKDGKLYIVGRNDAGNKKNLYISNSKNAVGEYPFGKFEQTWVRHYSYGVNYSSIYTCQSDEKYSPGDLLITKNDGAYVEGRVAGRLQFTGAPCSESDWDTATAYFRVKKTD